MLGKTHVSVGISTALLVTHPSTVSGVIVAVAGGALGGWICDIDVCESDEEEGFGVGLIFMIIDVVAALGIDHWLGNGICDYMVDSWNYLKIIPILIFIGLCIYGIASSHRTFTHSIVALIAFSFLIKFICDPFRIPFVAGFISHVVLDLFNKRGIQLFFPFKAGIAFHACDSDGSANRIIGGIGLVLSIILTVIFAFFAFQNDILLSDRFGTSIQEGTIRNISGFHTYLIWINIISFVVYVIDYLLCYNQVISEEDEDALHDFINIFAFIGGALGALLALVLFAEFGRANAYWFIKIGSLLAAWMVIYMLVVNPFGLIKGNIQPGVAAHLPITIYLIVINIFAIVLFIRDRFKRRSDIDSSEAFLLLIGALGGAIGGYAVMIITNGKSRFPHFSAGFPVLIAIHSFIILYLLYVGIV